jgi:hypothetical protein
MTAEAEIATKPKLFVPLSHNGSGLMPVWAMPMFIQAFSGYTVEMPVVGDSHADRAMNRLANDFIYSDSEELLIIDLDIVFSAEDLRKLLSHDLPLIYGVYPKKEDGEPSPCICGFAEGERARPVGGSLMQVRRAGRGFTRIHRRVFEAMKEDNGGKALRYHNHGRVEWCFWRSGVAEGRESCYPEGAKDAEGYPLREWKSEDWIFCDDALHLGFAAIIDVSITLGHAGIKVYRFSPSQFN